MSFEVKKIYTDNPYVDEMVYYTKIMGLGTVLKMQDLADKGETIESLKAGGLYISCVEGNAIFEQFTLTAEALNAAGVIVPATVRGLLDGTIDIYEEKYDDVRKKATEFMKNKYIEDYVELNPYYRMLHGLPPTLGQKDYVREELLSSDVVIDISKPIHEMDNAEAIILEQQGVLDEMIAEDPENRQYMRYLGKKRIDYYMARRSNRFDILYIPTIDSDAIFQMYRDKLDENKFYVLRTVYSDAFKYNSDYYDNFIAVFIVLITMIDIISRVQEFITRKEIFDIRSVQYIFKSYGVPFFEEIPLKYQISMVKNLHTLLKYKSTSKCMVDICSLFGFDNIKIFKYYLLKDRKIDITTGDYVYSESDDPEEKLLEEYELRFLKLPLDDDLDKYIRSAINYADYDEITDSDAKWDGGLDHDSIVKEILKEEFNFTRTKYISIDTIYEIAQMSAQQSYFFNFLYDNVELESQLTIQVPYISSGTQFRISDVFTLLTALTYLYNDTKDTIMDTQSKVLYVNGFNFKADLATLASELAPVVKFDNVVVDPKSTLHAREQLEKFQIPTSSIPTFKEMMNIYINNLEVRDELLKGMQEADNKKVYDVYKKLYDALMTVELTLDYYKNPETGDFYRDRDGDATYTEFLRNESPLLYSVIVETYNFEDKNSRNQYIANIIDSIIYALEEYIDTEEFQALFANLPIMSSEAVKQYIATVINFYKSYKVDFLGINTIYTLNDKNETMIRLIDSAEFRRYFERAEFLELREKISQFLVSKKTSDAIDIIDRIYFDISTWIEKHYSDNLDIKIKDEIATIIAHYTMHSVISIAERITKISIKDRLADSIKLYSEILSTSVYDTNDDIGVHDKLWIMLSEVEPRPQYHFKNVTIVNGSLIITDSRITKLDQAVFVPDLGMADLTDTISTVCEDGRIVVTSTSEYDITGEIIVN